jgi:hypothetical protein
MTKINMAPENKPIVTPSPVGPVKQDDDKSHPAPEAKPDPSVKE